MNQRRPRTALRSSALPSLGALIATGVVVFDGCGPQDASVARGDRLSSHGHNAARAVGDGRFGEALREVGMGLGLIDAPAPVDVTPAGAMPVVNPQPPEQPMAPSGGVAPVLPQPPPEQQPHPAGGPMMVDPAPAPPPPPPVQPLGHGDSRMEIGGGVSSVRPHPPTGPSSPTRR